MKKSLIFILSLLFGIASLEAAKSFTCQEDADAYLDEHYNLGCEYYNNQSWRKASNEFEKVIYFFPCTEDAAKASYYLAICYYEMKEYDFSSEEFSNYLKASQHPEFFEDAVYYKFCIAEHFKAGKKRRPFKMRYLPKWISAQDSALEIYDEVIAALPNHELTLCALRSKAELLRSLEEYRESIETYQTLIRRFPKNEIVPDCYYKIAETYFEQSEYEYQNPDILALAELNVRKFREQFPRDERVLMAEQTVAEIKELYAKGLCDLALFYERLKKPEAAAIYFQSAIEEFPDTKVSKFCRYRLKCLGYGQQEETYAEKPIQEICPEEETIPQSESEILPNGPREVEQAQLPIPPQQGNQEIQDTSFQQEGASPEQLKNEPDPQYRDEQAVPQPEVSYEQNDWECPEQQGTYEQSLQEEQMSYEHAQREECLQHEQVEYFHETHNPEQHWRRDQQKYEQQWGDEQVQEGEGSYEQAHLEEPFQQEPVTYTQWFCEPEQQVDIEQPSQPEYGQSIWAHEHPELQWGYEQPLDENYNYPYDSEKQWGYEQAGSQEEQVAFDRPSQTEDNNPSYIHYSLLKKKKQNSAPQRH